VSFLAQKEVEKAQFVERKCLKRHLNGKLRSLGIEGVNDGRLAASKGVTATQAYQGGERTKVTRNSFRRKMSYEELEAQTSHAIKINKGSVYQQASLHNLY
jgi:hypothetical protein